MSVMIKITQKISNFPFELKTPSGKKFLINHIDGERIQIETGSKPTIMNLPSSAFEESPDFLKGKGWLRIGATHDESEIITFDSFLKRFSKGTSWASYVAPILELAKIVEVDRIRPAKIKLND